MSHAGTTMNASQGPAVSDMPWLTSFSDVVEVFRSKDFVQGGGGLRDSAPIIGGGLLSLAGQDHFERRRIESALFRKTSLRFFERDVLAPVLGTRLRGNANSRGADGLVHVDLVGLLRSTFARVTAIFWGIDGVDSVEREELFLGYFDMIEPGSNAEWESMDHRDVIRRALRFMQLFSEEFFDPSFRRREQLVADYRAGRVAESDLPNDLITLMLKSREHFVKWDNGVFLRELILFHAGASIIRVVPYVVAELSNWLEGHPEDWSKVEDAGFLRRASYEALRLHPVSPYLIRKAERDTVLQTGRTFRAGDYVVLDVVAASRDTVVFGSDADRFDPHRVARIAIKPTGLAFSDGPHTCIGMAMSIGEVTATGEDPGEPIGFIVYILRELYRVGVRPDPKGVPQWNDANVRSEYTAFPVCLERL